MSRALFAAFVVVAVAVAAGCSHEGTYTASWSFGPAAVAMPPADDAGVADPDGGQDGAGDAAALALDDPDAEPAPAEPAESACSRHGVLAVRIIGVSSDGTGEDVTVPCTPGSYSHSVATGTWTFAVH